MEHIHHMQLAQHFFPSCVCAAVPAVVHLLEDTEVSVDGVAGQLILTYLGCLVS